MKQALTAGGLLSVWFESAKSALAELGIGYGEDRDIPSLKGEHPEFGKIEIEFFVPVQGKTRMEIAVDDPQMIAEFKKQVIPAYKYISDLVIRQTKAEMAEEEEKSDQEQPEQVDEVQETVGESAEDASVEPETQTDDNLFPDEVQPDEGQQDVKTEEKPEDPLNEKKVIEATPQKKVKYCKNCGGELRDGAKVCPKCGKKSLSGGVIALIIAGAVILIGGIGFLVYYFVGSGNNASNTQQTSTSQQTQTQQDSTSSDATTNPTVVLVTAEQFNQVQLGMTYEQVCAVLGREGTFVEPEAQVQNESGGVSTLRSYYWEAQGQEGANVFVTFQDGVAVTTSQFGLQ